MPLNRLIYVSECALAGPEDEQAKIVADIVATAAERNRKSDITGCLLWIDGHFIQILEGRIVDIEDTFERICCDFRHQDMQLIDHSPAKQRLFADWDMVLISDVDDTGIPMTDGLAEIRLKLGVDAREAVTLIKRAVDEQSKVALETP